MDMLSPPLTNRFANVVASSDLYKGRFQRDLPPLPPLDQLMKKSINTTTESGMISSELLRLLSSPTSENPSMMLNPSSDIPPIPPISSPNFRLAPVVASPIQYINLVDSTTSPASSPQVTAKTGVETLDSSFMVGNVRVGPYSDEMGGGGRAPCCDKTKVRTGPWSEAEDSRLINFIQTHGHGNWRALPKHAGLLRCGKSCRLRWINYLRPDVKRGNFTPEEERTIINLHNSIGNKWSKIASHLPGRTDNEIKNVWNTHLKKRLIKTEAKESQTGYSASPSCNSSSITSTCGDDHNMENTLVHHYQGIDQQSNKVKEPNEEKPEFLKVIISTHTNTLQDPVQSTKIEENGENHQQHLDCTKFDGEVEFSKWLNFLESEIGLTSDGDNLPKDAQEMNLEPEIISPDDEFDYFPIWHSSPQHLGI
ncbi:hypothetical protein BUALT_Bualt03G0168500 [Buddleja alternifolia]|uniref:Uncharacterized protein n=1 Tax=Buddleja alternifolia TaxID=168488 RepID=A0AAV6XUD7_9LAMI|nr:hypothetical protein BUALT_Bualt03G0168500 [Buddleja alternifolia]